jgi:hypothetical protein
MESVYLHSFINVDKWNRARWKGTAFMHDPSGESAPYLAIMFEDIAAGKEIFKEWRDRIGSVDQYEEIRISIIEGEIPGELPGYTVHISSNPLNTAGRAHANGLTYDWKKFAVIGRIKRMTPAPGSPHLGQFKKEMAKHQRYSIIPLSPKGEPLFDLAIGKKEVLFRQPLEITGNDLDAVVFPEHCFDGEKSVH